ncbi:methionine permease [Stygiomarasmius scandens]|uniref:Methionine permease n=1 Tax=Marasmiellus scandens TaxID=2682957 RepID=A0ABR1ISS6_9AGAR
MCSTGEVLLNAAGTEVTRWNQRAIGVGVVTFALIVHGVTRFAALAGHVPGGKPDNFKNSLAGAKTDVNLFINAMYNVICTGLSFVIPMPSTPCRKSKILLKSSSHINQELGREGVLPWSKFWASNKPFNSPLAGLTLQWAVTLIILAPPGGDAYNFLLNLISYPLNIFNALISFGLLTIYVKQYLDRYHTSDPDSTSQTWSPPVASLPITLFFFLANTFLTLLAMTFSSSSYVTHAPTLLENPWNGAEPGTIHNQRTCID